MKKLKITEIIITITLSYLVTSYIFNQFNPFELHILQRALQIVIISISLGVQLGIKNTFNE